MSDQTTNDLPIGGRALVACCAEREALRAQLAGLVREWARLREALREARQFVYDDDAEHDRDDEESTHDPDSCFACMRGEMLATIDAALRGKEPQV
jgi:hypothetical protein